MCGICGVLHRERRPGADSQRDVVERMAATLAHRGPDDRGAWVDAESGIALGHRRLAILDLSADGAQPMASACGRYVIAYNGEVYNFRELGRELRDLGHAFRGHSDTEVAVNAVAAWGVESALRRMNGMFAFALWDRKERSLTLARDRVGKKPLYYGWCGDTFLFASELKALRMHPDFDAEIDRDALGLLLQYTWIPAPYSIFARIRKLMPGTWLRLTTRGESLEPFWSARAVAERGAREPFAGSYEEAADSLEALLRDAVSRRMIADVPLGALLSGGIDSSSVVAVMQAISSKPVKTFSIGFREPRYDESRYARAIAEHLGTDHTELVVTADDGLELIQDLPRLYDEPFADTSQIPTTIVSRLARRDVTVALSGDGGDELFVGYKAYFRAVRQWRRFGGIPLPLRRAASAVLGRLATTGQQEKLAGRIGSRDVRELFDGLRRSCGHPPHLAQRLRAVAGRPTAPAGAARHGLHQLHGGRNPGEGGPGQHGRGSRGALPDPGPSDRRAGVVAATSDARRRRRRQTHPAESPGPLPPERAHRSAEAGLQRAGVRLAARAAAGLGRVAARPEAPARTGPPRKRGRAPRLDAAPRGLARPQPPAVEHPHVPGLARGVAGRAARRLAARGRQAPEGRARSPSSR
jgi:asparagine synthase (glutamine-hydrolysing)